MDQDNSHTYTLVSLNGHFPGEHGSAGCPLNYSNKGFWCKVLRDRCHSWRKPREILCFTFSAATANPKREGASAVSPFFRRYYNACSSLSIP